MLGRIDVAASPDVLRRRVNEATQAVTGPVSPPSLLRTGPERTLMPLVEVGLHRGPAGQQ